MSWTKPRRVADRFGWDISEIDGEGPACYELGTRGPDGGGIQWHYVGETKDESERIAHYAAHGSHISSKIDYQLYEKKRTLWYRAFSTKTKKQAGDMQNRRLHTYKYDWNKQRNRD